ncbi:MAG: M48 family metalloprotease [Gemmatimonadota bacterium]
MNFFEQQDAARRNSQRLVVLFVLAVIGVVLAVNVVGAFVYLSMAPVARGAAGAAALPKGFFLVNTLVTLALIGGGTWWETARLSAGGAAVAKMVDARLIDPSTSDLLERRLVNVVEEMAIASGIPVPRVYVMDHENTINAFAAGHSINDAIVAVTRGTLTRLNRDELQGVIGHEFSHILNGDMRLNLRLIGVLFGLVMIAMFGRFMMQMSRGNRDRGAGAFVIAGLVLWVVGYIGVLFGRLIKAAVSRQREFLADASSVQFTRNADGIGGALRKIGGLGGVGGMSPAVAVKDPSLPQMVDSAHELRARGVRVDLADGVGGHIGHAHAETLSHMFIAPARLAFARGWLSTHPPLEERIRRIYGRAQPFLPAPEQPLQLALEAATRRGQSAAAELPPLEFTAGDASASPIAGLVAGTAAGTEVHAAIGAPQPKAQDFARRLAQERSDAVEAILTDTTGVQLLVLGMLIEKGQPFSGQQRQLVTEAFGAAAAQRVDALHELMQQLPPGRRLPLLDRAMPALRKLSVEGAERLLMLCHALIAADGRVTLPEFLLFTVLKRRIGRNAQRAVPVKYRSIAERAADAALVLSLIAAVRLPERAEHAFNAGALLLPNVDVERTDAAAIHLDEVSVALERLNQLAPLAKPQLIKACTAAAFVDGATNWRAASCLRTICAALDAPLPPQVDGAPEEDRPAEAAAQPLQGELL